MIDMERGPTRGGIIADACGLGKTYILLARVLAATRYWTVQAQQEGREHLKPTKPTKPTLLTVR